MKTQCFVQSTLLPWLVLTVLFQLNLHAQQRGISYQGVIAGTNLRPLADSTYSVTFRLYDRIIDGNAVWNETHSVTTKLGVFDVILGLQSPLGSIIENVVFITMQVEGYPETTPRIQLATVPTAFFANLADTARNISRQTKDIVRSVNGADGRVTIVGDSTINVTQSLSGDTLTIRAVPLSTVVVVSKDASVSIKRSADTFDLSVKNIVLDSDNIKDKSLTREDLADDVLPTSLPPDGPAGGDLDGRYPNPRIRNGAVVTATVADGAVTSAKLQATGVVAGTYGDSTKVPVISVDKSGRLVHVEEQSVVPVPPKGAAGGDLTGQYPNPFIQSGAVTTPKLADESVTTTKILDGTIETVDLKDGSVRTEKLADNAVTTRKIEDGNVTTLKLADSSITTSKLAESAVTSSKLAENAVTTGKISDGNVTTAKLADGSITSQKIQDGAVEASDIRDSAITTIKLSNNAVTSSKISDGSVTGGKLAEGSVTTGKLAENAVTTAKIDDGSITNIKLADGAVTSQKIADGGVETVDFRDASITTPKLADGAITTVKITDGSVSTGKIADDAITAAKLSATGVSAGTYGSSTRTSRVTVDSKGRVLSADSVAIDFANNAWLLNGNQQLDSTANFIGSRSSQPLVVKTNNIERMRVTATGQVGIGTDKPRASFDVNNGNILLSNTNGAAGELRMQGKNDRYVAIRADSVVASTTYRLPASKPTANGQVLTADTNGVMSWKTSAGGGSRNGNASNGSFTAATSGNWIVPAGVTQVNILLKGSRGGKGGNATGPYQLYTGGAGGAPAFFSVTIGVYPGDTIAYTLGANGTDGVDNIGGWTGIARYASDGTAGGSSTLRINSKEVYSMTGGGGGTRACGGCPPTNQDGWNGIPGASGTITLSDFNNSGILVYSKEDVLGISAPSILIRY